MGIDNIRHPIKDTVKADNSTYSSNKIESLIHSATELPETGIEDAGDVLMVNDEGEWAKGEIIIPQEVPTPTSENIGKVVTVISDGDEGAEYGLETPSSGGVSIVDFRIIGSPSSFDEMVFYDNTKTLQDIIDAVEAGNIVRLYDSANDIYLSLTQFHSWPDPDPRESIVTMAFSATYPATYESPVVNKQETVYVEMENPTAKSLKLINT